MTDKHADEFQENKVDLRYRKDAKQKPIIQKELSQQAEATWTWPTLPLIHQKPCTLELMNKGTENLYNKQGAHMTLLAFCEGRDKQRTEEKRRNRGRKSKLRQQKRRENKDHPRTSPNQGEEGQQCTSSEGGGTQAGDQKDDRNWKAKPAVAESPPASSGEFAGTSAVAEIPPSPHIGHEQIVKERNTQQETYVWEPTPEHGQTTVHGFNQAEIVTTAQPKIAEPQSVQKPPRPPPTAEPNLAALNIMD